MKRTMTSAGMSPVSCQPTRAGCNDLAGASQPPAGEERDPDAAAALEPSIARVPLP
jgi:hypothetical protein